MLTSAVFLDMTKAIDGVNHETVILQLQDVGASNPVQWFCSYRNDEQVVQIHTGPITHAINCGVQQGSILRPLLFIINIYYIL